MNLEERLKKAGIDFFRTAQIYDNYLLNEVNVYLPWNTELHDYDITNARFATLYGLSCEYYLKGILLPTLTVTNPENDPRLQQIINDLSDEDKYRIIIGDDKIEKELSRKYNIRSHDIKKLYGESIKYIGHNLQALSSKILEKAENGKFEPERKNEVLKKLFRNNIFDFIFQNQVISYSFVKGRYAFLDGTKIDVYALEGALAILRDIVLYSTKGFNIILWDEDLKNNDIEILDRKRIFESEPQKIYVFKENDISRVYLWDGETLIPEYGVEEQIGEEISLYGTAKSYLDNSSPEELRKVLIYIRDENGIKEASIDNPNYWVNELKDKKPLSDGYNIHQL